SVITRPEPASDQGIIQRNYAVLDSSDRKYIFGNHPGLGFYRKDERLKARFMCAAAAADA
ncbi:MAG: hypothetical protein ACYC2R_16280, partial [Burkholderiales bacterium]